MAAAIAAPILAARSGSSFAAVLYILLSPVCHQIPERSFSFMGHPWAACHRCSGIYLGLLAAALFASCRARALRSYPARRAWVALGTLPLLADSLLSMLGIWTNTPWSRFITGLAFGAMLSSLLIPGVSELLSQGMRRTLRSCVHKTHGDLA